MNSFSTSVKFCSDAIAQFVPLATAHKHFSLVFKLWGSKNGEVDSRLCPLDDGYLIMKDKKVSAVGAIKYRMHEIITNFHDRCVCPCPDDDHVFLGLDIADFDYQIKMMGREDLISNAELEKVVNKNLKVFLIEKSEVVYTMEATQPHSPPSEMVGLDDSGLPMIPNLCELHEIRRDKISQHVLDSLEMRFRNDGGENIPVVHHIHHPILGFDNFRGDDHVEFGQMPLSDFHSYMQVSNNPDYVPKVFPYLDIPACTYTLDEMLQAKKDFGSDCLVRDPVRNIIVLRKTKDEPSYKIGEISVPIERQSEVLGFSVDLSECSKECRSESDGKTCLHDVGCPDGSCDWTFLDSSVQRDCSYKCRVCNVVLIEGDNCTKSQFRKGRKCKKCVIPPPTKIQKVWFETTKLHQDKLRGKNLTDFLAIDFEVDDRDRTTILEMGMTYITACCGKVVTKHYVVSDTFNNNGGDLSQTSEFAYGVTLFVPLSDLVKEIKAALDIGYILVSCDSRLETKLIFDMGFQDFTIVDVQILDDRYVQQRKSLESYCSEYSITKEKLHNAGNDAYAIFGVFQNLVNRVCQNVQLFPTFIPNDVSVLGCRGCRRTCVEKFLTNSGGANVNVMCSLYKQVNKENFKRYMLGNFGENGKVHLF